MVFVVVVDRVVIELAMVDRVVDLIVDLILTSTSANIIRLSLTIHLHIL